MEELPGQREWREWQAGVPQSGVLPPSPPPVDDDGGECAPILDPKRCRCGWIIVPQTAGICRRCQGTLKNLLREHIEALHGLGVDDEAIQAAEAWGRRQDWMVAA